MSDFFRRLQYLLNRRRLDRALANDMEFHREMAARHGRSNFGNPLHLREEARDAWGWTWVERLSQDLGYAARTQARMPPQNVVSSRITSTAVERTLAASCSKLTTTVLVASGTRTISRVRRIPLRP